MKATILTLAALLLTTQVAICKKNVGQVSSPHYGFDLLQVNSGTGQSRGYSLNASILNGRKALEVGLIYSELESSIAGGDFKYQVLLGNLNRIETGKKIFQPYLQYNLMYQKGTSSGADVVNLNGVSYELESDPGTVTTMGHFLAYGNKVRFFGRAYLDSSLGLGLYQGSMNKVDGPGTWGIHNENSGFTFSFKIGVGYIFN